MILAIVHSVESLLMKKMFSVYYEAQTSRIDGDMLKIEQLRFIKDGREGNNVIRWLNRYLDETSDLSSLRAWNASWMIYACRIVVEIV